MFMCKLLKFYTLTLDTDECQLVSSCDQICTNTRGSFVCSCHDGYRWNGNICVG